MEDGKKKTMKDCTARQVLALEYWKKDGCKSKARALRKAGYSEAVARQPHKVFSSPALRDLLFFLGIGDRLSQHKKEQGVTQKEWKREIERVESEKEKIDKTIQGMTPDQVSVLRERLMKEGYVPNARPQEIDTDFYSRPNSQDNVDVFEIISMEKPNRDIPSFSSM